MRTVQLDVRPLSHVDTPEWRSFETRMLARRAERRAQAARARRAKLARGAGIAALLAVAAALGFAITWILKQPIAFAAAAPTAPPGISLKINDGAAPLPTPEAGAVPIAATSPAADVEIVPDDLSVAEAPPPAPAASVQGAPLTPLPAPTRRAAAAAALEPPAAPVTIVPGTRENPTAMQPTIPRAPESVSTRSVEATDVVRATRVEPTPVGTAGSPSSPAGRESRAEEPPSPAGTIAGSLPDSRAAIRDVLDRYRLAYERLDAAAAGAVWPGVDRRALARAFDSLQSQQIQFRDCVILTAGATAHAMCTGHARAVPKIGSGGASEADRTWEFSLVQKGDDWRIAKATVK